MADDELELVATTDVATLIDAEWQERANRLQFQALSDIRATAQKWTATIASVTGIFSIAAFVKGPQDVTALRREYLIAVGILLAIAVTCALSAIILGALASQGTPQDVWTLGRALREFELREQDKASKELSWSRRLAILAVLPLIIAVGLSWYGPRDSKVNIIVENPNAQLNCKEATIDGAKMDLQAGAATVRVVSKCPD